MPRAPARRGGSESSDVARLVRLHHRRRGSAWVAAGSLIGLVVYAGIGVNLSGNLIGTTETLGDIPAFVLLALVLAGLVVVIVDTAPTRPSGRARRAAFRITRCTPTRIAIRRVTMAAGCSSWSCSSRWLVSPWLCCPPK